MAKKTDKNTPKLSLDNLKPALAERASLSSEKKRIEDRIKALDEELRPVLAGRGEIVSDGFAFKVAEVPGRTTYDYKAMVEDGIDLTPYAKTGRPSTRFTIRAVQEV